MQHIKIWTDGACSGNPGPTGWAYRLELWCPDSNVLLKAKNASGYIESATNNIGELTAVIEALKAIRTSCNIDIYSDSTYVISGITKWIDKWKSNDWKNSKKEEVKNKDLWLELDALAAMHNITWTWVKAHNGDPNNELVDQLAVSAYRSA